MPAQGEPKKVFQIYRLTGDWSLIQQILEEKGYLRHQSARKGVLLYINESARAPKWLPLVRQLSTTGIDLTNQVASFVLLRIDISSGGVYAVTGGQGYSAIHPFVDHEFGLEVASRLIDPDRIKAIRSRTFTGNIDQEEAYYRGYYNFNADPMNWVKLTRSILGELGRMDLTQQLGLDREDSRPIRLEGKASFSIRRSITLDELDTVFARLDSLMTAEPRIRIIRGCMEVQGEDKRSLDASLMDRLTSAYDQFASDQPADELDQIALSHDDARQLLACDSFSVSHAGNEAALEDLHMLSMFDTFRAWGLRRMPRTTSVRIEGQDDEGFARVQGTLKDFIEAELHQDGQTFLAVGKRWFRVTYDFVETLDRRLRPFMDETTDLVLPHWRQTDGKLETEDQYVDRVVCPSEHVYKLHRSRVVSQVERADLLVIRGSARYLVYVKRGLDSDMRVLARQAYESVALLASDQAFRVQAVNVMRAAGHDPGDDLNVRDFHVVLAVVDRNMGRGDTPLLSRTTTLAKIELAATFEYFQAVGMPKSVVHEIPIAAR